MARRTINLPDSTEARVREAAQEGESFSAAVTRMLEAGLRSAEQGRRPRYVAAGEGPKDLSVRAEHYLRAPVATR
jgi:plasmid stability protein